MTHRKQAASIKKEKNSFTPAAKTQKPAALSKPVVAGRDLLDAHVAALHDPRWTSNQKQALARQINQTYGNHHLQRILAAAPATIQRKQITQSKQKTYTQAKTMADYLALVHTAEQKFVGRSPRQMLALLRRVYFGKETWSLTTRKQWEDVLPKSPTMGDPRSQLGKRQGSLFAALQASQVVAGTDIGHLLTGLEALLNPKKSVEVEVFGPNPVVKMPNTEFATWGGDIGSAAGQMVADIFNKSKLKTPQDYFSQLASGADMEGNIDAFVLNKGAAPAGGLGALLGVGAKPGKGMAVSQILKRYYLTPSSALGKAHQNRYAIFVKLLGGKVRNKKIANQAALLDPIATRVTEFGYVWVLKEVKKKSGKTKTAALWAEESQLKAMLMPISKIMTRLLFRWLEARL